MNACSNIPLAFASQALTRVILVTRVAHPVGLVFAGTYNANSWEF